MRKGIKILIAVILLVLVAVSSFAIWQWKNIKSIYVGVTDSEEKIVQKRTENQLKLVEDVTSYMDAEVRDLTQEEKQKIENGEINVSDAYSRVFEETYEEIKNNHQADMPTKDEIVAGCVAKLYSLQSEYTARAETTISRGKAYYLSLRKEKDAASARAETIKKFTPEVRRVEASCDAEAAKIFAELENGLKSIGENTDISRTIKSAYENEKQLKLSYYANKYLK